MGLTRNKRDLGFFLLLIALVIVISQGGMIKYGILLLATLFFIIIKKKIVPSYYIILIPSTVYVVLGFALGFINCTLTFSSIKQALIYLCSGIFAISIFTAYGKDRSEKLVDIQFAALCIAYLILYARYFTFTSFYYESCKFAYIFGVYGLLYFFKKKYARMGVAIIFMLLDHKRITDAAFIVTFIILIVYVILKKKKHQQVLFVIGSAALIVVPIMWVWLCSNGFLESVALSLDIDTFGRLEGTGAWNIAKNYYEFTPGYIGKGIGWVLNWLEGAGIPSYSNLHNDFLVAYIELGFVGLIIWLLSFLIIPVSISKKDIKSANIIIVLIGFMFINFLTDNIYIYVTFLCPFYVILLSIMFGEENKPAHDGGLDCFNSVVPNKDNAITESGEVRE